MKQTLLLCLGLILQISVVQSQNTVWSIDKSHSSIGFSVDHLVISETVGQFNDYTALVKADKSDFTDASFSIEISVNSIDTKDAKRDGHLKSADFFDVEKYPTIVFTGKSFEKVSGNNYKVNGTMTIHGISKEVSFDATFGGIIKDSWGGTRAGLKIIGIVDRYEYDLKYNSILEAGGLSIGQEVRIECRLELIKAK